jgi:sodium transport system permease protein
MSWRNIKLIWLREVRDQLRDRRTVFMVAVLPLLLYPALGIGMLQMTLIFTEQPRTVVILGANSLPADPPLLVPVDPKSQQLKFNPRWFTTPQDADKLLVVSDASQGNDSEQTALLAAAREIKKLDAKRQELDKAISEAKRKKQISEADQLARQLQGLKEQMNARMTGAGIQVLLLIPDGLASNIERINRELATRTIEQGVSDDYPRPVFISNSADDKSSIAYGRVKGVVDDWEQKILQRRLAEAHLPPSLPTPVAGESTDLAAEEEMAASLWSKLFPTLLVIMAVTGAFYPAVDVAAGEKERGTMETLLISPAKRSELVVGKFLAVMLFSMATAILNLVSIGMTGKYMAEMAGKGVLAKIGGDIPFPPIGSLAWVIILLVPLSALFSALCLALATFARSTKEGQYYLTPLLMVVMGLTVFCLSPAVEITPFYSVMPVMGIALLLKGMLSVSAGYGELYAYTVPVLVTSFGYSLLALWWAIEQFKSEEVLFREAERFELGLWLRHLLRDKESTPSFTEAGFCFVLIMLLQFVPMRIMGEALAAASESTRGIRMMQILIIQQLVVIASPALFMALLLTTSIIKTLQLRLPRLRYLAVALLLPLAIHPLSLELATRLSWFFPALPSGAADAMKSMGEAGQPLLLVLLAFAIVPACCEEIAFRGFILSGFRRSGRVGVAIVLSSVAFGAMHMIPQQVFNATLLGLVLGLLAVRSGSILPCIIFHCANNTLAVIHARIAETAIRGGFLEHFFFFDPHGLRYGWPVLIVCGIAAGFVLRWLANQHNDGEPTQVATVPSEAGITRPHTAHA